MRTTLTLDDDVAARLEIEARRTGKSFKETVNELLRLALAARREQRPIRPFAVRPRALGLAPGRSYDNIDELLEQAEGPRHR